jgi:hypothetical protein
MVDMSAIGVVANSLTAAVNIAKALMDVRDATTIQAKVFELQRAIIDAQQSVFAANEERSGLIQQVNDLEKEQTCLKEWEAEKLRYELVEIAPGILAYAIRESMRGAEPFHYLCANCYTSGRKSFLQQQVRTPRLDRYKCTGCGEELSNDKDRGPISTHPRDRSLRSSGPQSWMGS